MSCHGQPTCRGICAASLFNAVSTSRLPPLEMLWLLTVLYSPAETPSAFSCGIDLLRNSAALILLVPLILHYYYIFCFTCIAAHHDPFLPSVQSCLSSVRAAGRPEALCTRTRGQTPSSSSLTTGLQCGRRLGGRWGRFFLSLCLYFLTPFFFSSY